MDDVDSPAAFSRFSLQNVDTKKGLKERRTLLSFPCGNRNCTKKGNNLPSCGGCKVEHYCSRECQKAAWSFHKAECMPESAKRMIKHMYASEMFLSHIEMLAIGLCKLVRADARAFHHLGLQTFMVPEKSVRPRCSPQMLREPIEEGTRGVLHVHRVYTRPWDELSEAEKSAWIQQRKELDNSGQGNFPLVALDIGGMPGQTKTMYLPMSPVNIAAARPSQPGEQVMEELPYFAAFALQRLNDLIIRDERNQLKFRVPMTRRDIEILRTAVVGSCMVRREH